MSLGIVLEECPGGGECWGMSVVNVRIPFQNGIREIWSSYVSENEEFCFGRVKADRVRQTNKY